MAIPCGRQQRELNKFIEDPSGETAVNTVISGGSVGFTPSGLDKGFRVTTLIVTETAGALPLFPFAERESISIHNKSETQTIFIGNSNVTADTVVGVTSGYELLPGGFFNVDITPDIILYGRTTTGSTAFVKILEIA